MVHCERRVSKLSIRVERISESESQTQTSRKLKRSNTNSGCGHTNPKIAVESVRSPIGNWFKIKLKWSKGRYDAWAKI